MTARATTAAARRRGHALVDGDVGFTAALAIAVEALELPGDPRRWAAVLPPAAIGAGCVAALVGGPVLVAAVVAGAASGVIAARRTAPARRAAAVDTALPGVLERVANQLRSGASVTQAVAGATPAGNGELALAWRKVVANAEVVGIAAALAEWVSGRDRPARTSERLVAAALTLAAQTGGSPARAIDGVAATLRARIAVAQELRALTSQARLSAGVIAAGPLLFGMLAGLTDRSTSSFFRSPAGAAVLALGLALDLAGAVWMRRLCRTVG